MNPIFLASVICALLAAPLFAEPTATRAEPALNELKCLKQEHDRRRAAALRPLAGWYRSRLEELQRRAADSPESTRAEIAQAVAAARESFWQEDQPELREALIASPWLWRSDEDSEGVTTVFRPNGTVEHVGMSGTWRITGPCEVTLMAEGWYQFILRFNASLSAYEGDHRGVSGHRIAPHAR